MRTANTRDLRNNFRKIAAWIEAGEEVEITRRGKAVARLVPSAPLQAWKPLDVEARLKELKEVYGDRITSEDEMDEFFSILRKDRGEDD
jgi:prevent-host-death family protein